MSLIGTLKRKPSRTWTLEEAQKLIKEVEYAAPFAGFHVALTGGLLYKDGPRKDLDLMFYSIRQVPMDLSKLEAMLAMCDIVVKKRFGWMYKATYKGKDIDVLVPEATNDGNPYVSDHPLAVDISKTVFDMLNEDF